MVFCLSSLFNEADGQIKANKVLPVPDSLVIDKEWNDTFGAKEIKILVVHPLIGGKFTPGVYSTLIVQFNNNYNKNILYQDTCNWQMGQFLFYDSSLAIRDFDNDGINGVRFVYKVAGMDYEDDTVKYFLFYKDTITVISLKVKYDFDISRYKIETSERQFSELLPKKLKNIYRKEYLEIAKLLLSYSEYP